MFLYLFACARSIELELQAEVNSTYANGRGGTYLKWTHLTEQDVYYKLYQKSKDSNGDWSNWKQISLYIPGMNVSVLNVYPSQVDGYKGQPSTTSGDYNTYMVNFTFGNDSQTHYSLPKSASLKLWMEGGTWVVQLFETKNISK